MTLTIICKFIFYIMIISTFIESKPLDSIEHLNEIDHKDDRVSESIIENIIPSKSTAIHDIDEIKVTNDSESSKPPSHTSTNNNNNNNINNLWSSLLQPLLQKFQFSPQAFFQDRLNALKGTLTSLGLVLPFNGTQAKQLGSTALLHLVGLNDNGFYTDRLEPAGFFGGNGWLANKGGLLGGPGAILSTGPILTDYPTAYKKR